MKKSKSHLSFKWKLDLSLNVPVDHERAADLANRVLLAACVVVTLTLGAMALLLLAGS